MTTLTTTTTTMMMMIMMTMIMAFSKVDRAEGDAWIKWSFVFRVFLVTALWETRKYVEKLDRFLLDDFIHQFSWVIHVVMWSCGHSCGGTSCPEFRYRSMRLGVSTGGRVRPPNRPSIRPSVRPSVRPSARGIRVLRSESPPITSMTTTRTPTPRTTTNTSPTP